MGLARLDDAEFARRARERNTRVNAAHRQRLLEAGKAQTNVWLSATLRRRLDEEAAAVGVSLSAMVERLLSAALLPATPATVASDPDTLPLFEPDSIGSSPVESAVDRHTTLMLELDRRVNAGEKWRDIATALNEAGWRDKAGKPLVYSCLNEQWRAWKRAKGES